MPPMRTKACAATPSCTLGSDIIGQFMREDDLIVEPLTHENGHVLVPQGPGLGVGVSDRDALSRYAVERGDSGMPGMRSVSVKPKSHRSVESGRFCAQTHKAPGILTSFIHAADWASMAR